MQKAAIRLWNTNEGIRSHKKKIKNTSAGSGDDEEEGRCPTELLVLVNVFLSSKTPKKKPDGFACENKRFHARDDND